MVPFTPDFGTVSALQSDLIWTGSVHFDTKGERKATVSNPSMGIAYGDVGAFFGNGCRYRQVSINVVVRQLWQHQV